jgi:hypothetical protein
MIALIVIGFVAVNRRFSRPPGTCINGGSDLRGSRGAICPESGTIQPASVASAAR